MLNIERLKKSYTQEELYSIYELGRFFLENGMLRQAEIIFSGLCNVAPDFVEAHAAMAIIKIELKDYHGAVRYSSESRRGPTEDISIMLIHSCALILNGDTNLAGAELGEISEILDRTSGQRAPVHSLFEMMMSSYKDR